MPKDQISFTQWIGELLRSHGNGYYVVTRTQGKGESKGFKPVVGLVFVNGEIEIQKRYMDYPTTHPNERRQAWFKYRMIA